MYSVSLAQQPVAGLSVEQHVLAEESWGRIVRDQPFHHPDSRLSGDPRLNRDDGGRTSYNFSLATQLAVAHELIGSNNVPGVVTGYFYTANSAAPLAHTLRGYFDDIEAPHPPILPIDKSRVDRLRKVIKRFDISNAIVIDQYVCEGNTLRVAAQELHQAGLPMSDIYAVGSRLYHQLKKDGEDVSNTRFALVKPEKDQLAMQFYRAGQLLAQQTTKVRSLVM
jgi:hypothetical protein